MSGSLFRLDGKIAVVTGAARGIGRSAAVALARLIDTTLARHEDRCAQALQTAGQTPSGNEAKDEAGAKAALTKKSPLGVPWIDPGDIAPMVVFLASDQARMVSGGSFPVTAGDSANVTA